MDADGGWVEVAPDGVPVGLPFRPALAATGRAATSSSSVKRKSGSSYSVGSKERAPRIVLEPAGWHAACPVALDRLGIFFRIIRLRKKEARQDQKHMAPLTRLVIEIVRRGSAQNLVVVRSGLTLTNDLSPHLSLEVGLSNTTPSAPGGPLRGSRPLVIPYGQTRALPLDLAATASSSSSSSPEGVGGGSRLVFRPVVTAPGPTFPEVLFDWSQQLFVVLPQAEDIEDTDTVMVRGRLRTANSPREWMDWRRLVKPSRSWFGGGGGWCMPSCYYGSGRACSHPNGVVASVLDEPRL